MNLIKKIKTRWNITSNFQFIVIMIVFAITGSLSLFVSRPLLSQLGVNPTDLSLWLYYPLRIILIFTIYHIVIVIIGTIFGQFDFFWRLEKKMLRRIGFKRFFKKDNLD